MIEIKHRKSLKSRAGIRKLKRGYCARMTMIKGKGGIGQQAMMGLMKLLFWSRLS